MMGLSSKRRLPAVLVAAAVAASVLMGCREKTKPPTTKPATTRPAAADSPQTQPAAHPATAGIEWVHLKAGKIKVPGLRKSLELSRAIAISAAPITCEQYARFLRATRHRPPKIPPDDPVFKFKKLADVFQWQDSRPPKGCADWPVALVSRHDAEAYCQWLAKSTGRVHRLPTWQELRFALMLDGTWRDKVSSTSLGEPGGSGSVVWYGLGPVGAKNAIRSIVGLRCFPMALSEWTSGDWVCSPTIGNATRSNATHSYYRQNLGRLLNVYGFRIVTESKAADPTATQPAGQRKFEDAIIFVDNYLSGVKNGATRPLSSQGWVACGRPGAGGKVSWRYLRTTGRGDEYEITRALPRAVARRDRLGTMQITYAGVPFVVFTGKNKRVVLLPGRFKNVHTDGPKTDDALILLEESRARELIFNMDLLATPAALPALTAVVRDAERSKYARKIAAALLGRIGSRDARDTLIMVLRETPEPDFDMGGSMWSCLLNAIGECIDREPEKQLLDDLKHGHPQVRWLAASQLGRRKSAAAVPALIALLDDKHPVQLGATWALGEIGDVRGDEVLFAIVEGRRSDGSVVSAIEAMGKIGTDRALAAVKSIKADHPGHLMAREVLASWGSNFRKPAARKVPAATQPAAKPSSKPAASKADRSDAAKDVEALLIQRLQKAIAARLPKNWTMRPMETGEVKPVHWPKGEGLHILAQRRGFVPGDWKRGLGGRVCVWIMGKDYAAKGPQHGEAQAFAATEIDPWRGHRVLIWGGGADWKGWEEDIQAALQVSTQPPTKSRSNPATTRSASPPGAHGASGQAAATSSRTQPATQPAAWGRLEELLKKLKTGDKEARIAAAKALGELRDPRAVPALVAALKNRNIVRFRWGSHEGGWLESDKNVEIRTEAALALGRIASPAAVEPLIATLRDRSLRLRIVSMQGLGQIGDKRAIEPMRRLMLKPPDGRDALAASKALAAIGGPEAIEAIAQLFKGRYVSSRVDAIRALVAEGSTEAIDAIEPALSDENAGIRSMAIRVMAEVGTDRAVAILARALASGDRSIRYRTVWALGQIGSSEALRAMKPACSDKHDAVREAVARHLGRFHVPGASELARLMLRDKTAYVRMAAARSLALIGGPDDQQALIKLLDEPDYKMRARAVWSLGWVGQQESIKVLEAAAKDKDNTIRYNGRDALAMVRGRLAFREATRTATQLAGVMDVQLLASAGHVFRGRRYKTPQQLVAAMKQSAGEGRPPVRIATKPRFTSSRAFDLLNLLAKAGFKNVAVVRFTPAQSAPAPGAKSTSKPATTRSAEADSSQTKPADRPIGHLRNAYTVREIPEDREVLAAADTLAELVAKVRPDATWESIKFLWAEKDKAGKLRFRLNEACIHNPRNKEPRWVLLGRTKPGLSGGYVRSVAPLNKQVPVHDGGPGDYAVVVATDAKGGRLYQVGWESEMGGAGGSYSSRQFYVLHDKQGTWRIVGELPDRPDGSWPEDRGYHFIFRSYKVHKVQWTGNDKSPVRLHVRQKATHLEGARFSEDEVYLLGLPSATIYRDGVFEGDLPAEVKWGGLRHLRAQKDDTAEKIVYRLAIWTKDADDPRKFVWSRRAWREAVRKMNPETIRPGKKIPAGTRINLPTAKQIAGAIKAESANGMHGPDAARALLSALRDLHPGIRGYAARMLGKIGAPAKVAVPALEEALTEEKEARVRRAIAKALKKIQAGTARKQ